MLAISLALVFVLILALDRPFRGDLAISRDRFEEINLGIVPAMKIDLQEVLADDTEFRGRFYPLPSFLGAHVRLLPCPGDALRGLA